jgi:hypothetical protein
LSFVKPYKNTADLFPTIVAYLPGLERLFIHDMQFPIIPNIKLVLLTQQRLKTVPTISNMFDCDYDVLSRR